MLLVSFGLILHQNIHAMKLDKFIHHAWRHFLRSCVCDTFQKLKKIFSHFFVLFTWKQKFV
jgi:hypothetical protein